jgi:hypothetical protein
MDITYLLRLKEHTVERYHIRKLEKSVQIKDKITITKNRIFGVIFKHDSERQNVIDCKLSLPKHLQCAVNHDIHGTRDTTVT